MLKKPALIIALIFLILMTLIAAGCSSQKESRPLALLTDFGSGDYRVPLIKGIIYNNYPDVKLIEASEDVPAFDIPTGAFILDIAAKEFPNNTIFVVIVSPYDQVEIRYIVLTADNGKIFIVPDNGVATYVIKDTNIKSIYQINNQKLFDEPIAQMAAERIEGKIGALIASGYKPQDIGIAITQPRTLDIQEPAIAGNKLLGTVIYVDNFGNCVTNISGDMAKQFGLKTGDPIQIGDGSNAIAAKFGTTYGNVPKGSEVVFVNGNLGRLQLSINLGNFAATYKVTAGEKIEIGK